MTAARVVTRPELEHIATLLAGALSGGRRRRARLDSGPARTFQTDLRTVTVPVPLPHEFSLRLMTCGIALQASPTKDAVARARWTGLSRRQQRALCWEEGEQAVRWARTAWPGLRDELDELFDWVPEDAAELEPETLVERALARGGEEDPPPMFGRLPPPLAGDDPANGRRTFIATRWSSRHKAKRSGALPIPVSGPGTEPVLDPGAPGTMEALDGRAGHAIGIAYDEWDATLGNYRRGHVHVLEIDEPAPAASAPARLPAPDMRPARVRRRNLETGDVDIDAVVKWRVDLAAQTSTGEPRLFGQLAPAHEPLAWAFLIDASASSSLRGGNILRRSAVFADVLARSLCETGEQVGVFAFRSHGRERVEVRVLKHFDRPYVPLGIDLTPGGYTRLGGAVRHVGARLLDQPARAHVLVSLGDAVPYDEGYGEAYGSGDVAKAVQELRARGAHVLHGALATRDDAALDGMFGPGQWRHVRRAADVQALIEAVGTDVRRGTA